MVDERIVNTTTQLGATMGGSQQKCFLCFGTLLFFIREQQFSIDSDIDIGVIGDIDAVISMFSTVFRPIRKIVDDSTGQILNITFSYNYCPVPIDLYLWKKMGAHYYHCYDERMENKEVLSQYHFKGTPAECFDVSLPRIKALQDDTRYNNSMTNFGTWKKRLPQCPTEGGDLYVPCGYGYCLDVWYPDFAVSRPQFGVSKCHHDFTVSTCKGLKWES